MKNNLCLLFLLIMPFALPAQNRFYAGVNLGATICFSNYVDNHPPSPYVAIRKGLTVRYGLPLFWYINKSIFLETGVRFVPTVITYNVYSASFTNSPGWSFALSGYNSFQIPFYLGKNLELTKASYGTYHWFFKGGAIYTNAENTDFSTGLSTPYPDSLTRGFHNVNWMAYAGTGILLVFKNDNRLSFNVGYTHGFRTIFQEHVVNKVIGSKGNNIELSFSYCLPLTSFLPKKWRNTMVSENATNAWFKFFYLQHPKEKRVANNETDYAE